LIAGSNVFGSSERPKVNSLGPVGAAMISVGASVAVGALTAVSAGFPVVTGSVGALVGVGLAQTVAWNTSMIKRLTSEANFFFI